MAGIYARMAATAVRLLAKFGTTATLSQTSSGSYDPVSGEVSGEETNTYTVRAVVLDYTMPRERDGVFSEGTLVRAGDKKILCEPGVVVPEAGDSLLLGDQNLLLDDRQCVDDWLSVDGGLPYEIIRVKTVSPAGTPVLYELQARR